MQSVKTGHPTLAGFTLIETLVALAVIGIALAAALKATHSSIDMAGEMKTRTAAAWVASNIVNQMQAIREFPELGAKEGDAKQGMMDFHWRQEVSISPNFSFRRVEVKVFLPEDPEHILAKQVSYVARVQE